MSNRTATDNLQKYFELSEAFHSPKGDGYKTVRRLLEKYLDLQFICENNFTQFHGAFFDKDIEHLFYAAYPEITFDGTDAEKSFSTTALLQILDTIVSNMESHNLVKYQEYGRVLRATYMSPEYAALDTFELKKLLQISNKRYYKVRQEAISLISEIFFGTLVGENGFNMLQISNNGIYLTK